MVGKKPKSSRLASNSTAHKSATQDQTKVKISAKAGQNAYEHAHTKPRTNDTPNLNNGPDLEHLYGVTIHNTTDTIYEQAAFIYQELKKGLTLIPNKSLNVAQTAFDQSKLKISQSIKVVHESSLSTNQALASQLETSTATNQDHSGNESEKIQSKDKIRSNSLHSLAGKSLSQDLIQNLVPTIALFLNPATSYKSWFKDSTEYTNKHLSDEEIAAKIKSLQDKQPLLSEETQPRDTKLDSSASAKSRTYTQAKDRTGYAKAACTKEGSHNLSETRKTYNVRGTNALKNNMQNVVTIEQIMLNRMLASAIDIILCLEFDCFIGVERYTHTKKTLPTAKQAETKEVTEEVTYKYLAHQGESTSIDQESLANLSQQQKEKISSMLKETPNLVQEASASSQQIDPKSATQGQMVRRNLRNGYYERSLSSKYGYLSINHPRARNGIFNSNLIRKKYVANAPLKEDLILTLYTCTTTEQFELVLSQLFDPSVEQEYVHTLAESANKYFNKWRKQKLPKECSFLCIHNLSFVLDGGECEMPSDISPLQIWQVALGIMSNGQHKILSINPLTATPSFTSSVIYKKALDQALESGEACLPAPFTASLWYNLLNDLSNRGLSNPHYVCMDGAIEALPHVVERYPQAHVVFNLIPSNSEGDIGQALKNLNKTQLRSNVVKRKTSEQRLKSASMISDLIHSFS